MRMIGVIAGFMLAVSDDARAGAWTQPAGAGQVIVTTEYSFAQDAFDSDGKAVAIQPFEKFGLRAYAEYGVTDWATVIAQPELRFKHQGRDDVGGLGRFDLGLRVRLWEGSGSVLSLEGTVSAPGASDELAPLNGGDTDWEVDGRALFGYGFSIGSRAGFADLQAGYRLRFDEPADEFRLDATVGLDLTDKSFAMLQSFNRISVGTARLPFDETLENEIALSTVYRFDERWSLQVGTKVTAYGRNVLRQQGIFIGIWSKF